MTRVESESLQIVTRVESLTRVTLSLFTRTMRCQPRAQTISLMLGNWSPVARFNKYYLAKILM